MSNLRKYAKNINIQAPLLFDEPMARHTSFKVGGPADLFVSPSTEEELSAIYSLCLKEGIPHFILGEGANILVADKGIRGIVIHVCHLREMKRSSEMLYAGAGKSISELSEAAAAMGLAGLDSFSGMPGSVGGSIWINARCYETSLADVLQSVDILDSDLHRQRIDVDPVEFGYKSSPFQNRESIILGGTFHLSEGDPAALQKKMAEIRRDRERKGHYRYPSAGSFFKNNRSFGSPTGKIIDSLGLKGEQVGGAKVSHLHANILINTGSARAADILELAEIVSKRVYDSYGFRLEREIILVGEWEESHG